MTAPTYLLELGASYYDKGFFNLGVEVDRFVRPSSGTARLLAGEARVLFAVRVDREANPNGAPRIMGGPEVRNWIQRTFRKNETVVVEILSPDEFWIHKK